MFKHQSTFLGIVGALVLATATGAASAKNRGCMSECYEAVAPKAIHKTYKYRITTQQGVYEIDREPSLYGWAKQPVYEWHEAVYRTETVTKKLPARTTWEMRLIGERYVKCKVRVPAEVVEEEREVLVSPEGYVKTGAFAEKRILLKPYKNLVVYHKAHHHYEKERVNIQPEGVVWHRLPKSALYE